MTVNKKTLAKQGMRCRTEEDLAHFFAGRSNEELQALNEIHALMSNQYDFSKDLIKTTMLTKTPKTKEYIKKPELTAEEKEKIKKQKEAQKEKNKLIKQQKKKEIKQEITEAKKANKPTVQLVQPKIKEPQSIDDIANNINAQKIEETTEQTEMPKNEIEIYVEEGKAIKTFEWEDAPTVLVKNNMYAPMIVRPDNFTPVTTVGEARQFYSQQQLKKYKERCKNYGIDLTGYKHRQLKPLVKVKNPKGKGPSLVKEYDRLLPSDILLDGRIDFNKKTRKEVYNHNDGVCQICGQKVSYDEFEIDHIKPLAKGGNNEINNLQCTCRFCNRLKADNTEDKMRNKLLQILTYQTKKNNKFKERIKGIAEWL